MKVKFCPRLDALLHVLAGLLGPWNTLVVSVSPRTIVSIFYVCSQPRCKLGLFQHALWSWNTSQLPVPLNLTCSLQPFCCLSTCAIHCYVTHSPGHPVLDIFVTPFSWLMSSYFLLQTLVMLGSPHSDNRLFHCILGYPAHHKDNVIATKLIRQADMKINGFGLGS